MDDILVRDDAYFMRQAFIQAQIAYEEGEVPVGAVVVLNGKIIARGHNEVEKLKDPTAHAEIIALTSAFQFLGAKYLPDASLYVTVEPCLMCAGAIFWSKLGKIVWGADDEKNGHVRLTGDKTPFHPKATIIRGVMKEECAKLMRSFFEARR